MKRSSGRRRPVHPEARYAALKQTSSDASAVRVPATGWSWRYGWLIVLVEPNGAKHYRDVPSSVDYEGACELRDIELMADDSRYEKAWLIQKTFEPENGQRPQGEKHPDFDDGG